MGRPRLRLCLDSAEGDPALDTAVSRAVLDRVEAGELPATLRLSRPPRLVAFSARDRRSPGLPAAVEAAGRHGFAAVSRLAGGRPAVFTPHTIAFALAEPTDDPPAGIEARFARMAEALRTAALRWAPPGVGGQPPDARIGEVPGEYCPGQWSVNLDGARKVAGIGQRLLRRSAHTGGVLVVGDAADIREVLIDVYAAMELAWDPATVGQLLPDRPAQSDLPDQSDPVAAGPEHAWVRVRDALIEAFAADVDLEPWRLDRATLERARALLAEHRLTPGAHP